jgi:glycosyltransferase involved in cell wall biosynthesis
LSGPVALDLVAAQSPSYRNRGIARHGLAYTEALLRRHPDLVGSVLLHPELPPVAGLDAIVATGKAVAWSDWPGGEAVFHLTSAFEPEMSAKVLWPRRAVRSGMKLAVTVYDLIPEVFPDMYLMDPGLRRMWRAGREIVRVADHVFTLADSGVEDVVRLLGVDERRVSVIGAGVDERFHKGSRVEAGTAARASIDGLGADYVVYNGAIDPRKNLERLVEAFAELPEGLRRRYQLVLPCRATEPERNHFFVKAERLGIGGRVVMPGFVTDEVLVALYQSAYLVVFPSLYEGYGLPVVEAMACGAPVIVADNSSLRELVEPEARFDALDVSAIAAAMRRALTDDDLYARLVAASSGPAPGWDEVADRAAAGYEQLLARPSVWTGWRRRPLVAVVGPDTAETTAVVDRMRVEADVDRLTNPHLSASGLAGADRAMGGYDGLVVWLGDDPSYAGSARLFVSDDGLPLAPVVVAKEASLISAFAAAVASASTTATDEVVGAVASVASVASGDGVESLGELVARFHPGSERADLASPERLARSGYLLARPAIAASARYFVPTDAIARRVRVDAAPGDSNRVEVLDVSDPETAARRILEVALAGR